MSSILTGICMSTRTQFNLCRNFTGIRALSGHKKIKDFTSNRPTVNRSMIDKVLDLSHNSLETHRCMSTNVPKKSVKEIIDELLEKSKKNVKGVPEQSACVKIDSQNIFDLFQLRESFIISESSLKREYLKLQRSIHPDKFVQSGKEAQDCADNLSALINDAYETLRHPYKRAKYLLSLKMKISQDELDKKMDSLQLNEDFLARMMELREEVELGKDMNLLERIAAEVDDDLTRLMISMNAKFKEGDTKTLLEQLGRLKFLGNLHVKLAERTETVSTF